MIFETRNILFIVFAMAFISNSCGLFGELGAIVSSPQEVSGAVEIKEEWAEITPPKPLRSSVKTHKFSVQTDDVKGYDASDKNAQTLEFENGKRGKVEAILFDDKGNEYILGIVGVGGKNGGFYLGKVHSLDKPNLKEADFPKDRVYSKLKIRSEVIFQIKKIEWISEVQK